ncbi:MAG TPA: hypothetical protein PLI09_13350 [Candidatus Hydrogenedentes bacterium]|nr:hypothetical protein [Candidatus Hydrogenedentota bacterium]
MIQLRWIVPLIFALIVLPGAHGDLVEATFPTQSAPPEDNTAPTLSPVRATTPEAPSKAPTTPASPMEHKPPQETSTSWWAWLTGTEKEEKPIVRSEDVEQLRAEVSALRHELKQLSETLDLMINRVMADLENENAQLREELRKAYGESGMPLPPQVPRPGGELVDQVLSEAPLPEYPAAPEAAPQAPVAFNYTVLQEWGRSPEAAEELGGTVSSLKGMVCVVPKGSHRADLEAMGRELRKMYEQFDNINIEVFDDEEAAKNYAEQNKMSAAHRVLSVSKHQASGRDTILYYENGATYEVSL